MSLQRILQYIIISLVLLFQTSLFAQDMRPREKGAQENTAENKRKKEKEKEKEAMKDRVGFIRLGVDPFSTVKSFIYPATVSGITFQLDTEVKGKYLPVVEVGNENFSMDHDNYDMLSTGFFMRLGVDQNFVSYLNSDDRDIFYAGLRYCVGSGTYGVDNIVLPNALGDETINLENEAYFTQWGELTAGVKTELFSNLFLGWTVRVKRRLSFSNMAMDPYYVAGYGKGENPLNVEMSVQVLYALPYKFRKK